MLKQDEVWKYIKGFNYRYKISNKGKIFDTKNSNIIKPIKHKGKLFYKLKLNDKYLYYHITQLLKRGTIEKKKLMVNKIDTDTIILKKRNSFIDEILLPVKKFYYTLFKKIISCFIIIILLSMLIVTCTIISIPSKNYDKKSKIIKNSNNEKVNFMPRYLTNSDRLKIEKEINYLVDLENSELLQFSNQYPHENDLNKFITARATILVSKSTDLFPVKFKTSFDYDISIIILSKLARIQGMRLTKNEIENISQEYSDNLAQKRNAILLEIKQRNNNFLFLDSNKI